MFGGRGTAGISPLEKKLYGFSSSSHLLELNTCVDVLKVSSLTWEFRYFLLGGNWVSEGQVSEC